MNKILFSLILFFGGFHLASAQINIKVTVTHIAVSSALDCDAGAADNSDFVFEYKASDNSPSSFSNNSPVLGSIGMCNYAFVTDDNGPYNFSPSAPGSAVFSPTTGVFFDHNYNCKNQVPNVVTITWRAYENDDVSAPSVTPIANGVIPVQTNTFSIPSGVGTYTAQHTQTSADVACPQTYIIQFKIEKTVGSFYPLALGLPESNVICTGASDGFVDVSSDGGSGPVLYDWSFDGLGDFDDNSREAGLSAGTYTLVVKDGLNCTDTSVVTIFSTNAPANISAFSASTASVCTEQTGVMYSVATQTNATFYWSFSGPGGVMNGSGNAITMNFLSFAGDGVLSVYAQNSCSTSPTLSMAIAVVQSPNISILGNSTVCDNAEEILTASGAITYTWSTGDTTASAIVSPSVNTVYTVTATGLGGCISTEQFWIRTLISPTVQVTASTVAVCPNSVVPITATGNGSMFFWSDGFVGANHSVKALSTTVFTVTNTFTNSCYAQATFTLNVNAPPIIAITGNTAVCEGGTVSLTAAAHVGDTYVWSDGSTSNTTSFVPVSSSTLGLVVTGADGCQDSVVKIISVLQTPTVNISGVNQMCEGDVVVLTATANGTVTYGWNSGANTASISVSPLGIFTYIVTVDNGACVATASHQLVVNLIPTVDFYVSPAPLCTTDGMITFTANPSGGTFSGTGVTMGNMFDPIIGVGSYPINYQVSLLNGCSANATQTVDVMVCTSLDNAKSQSVLTLFPNPTSAEVTIKSDKEIVSILVYDFSGKLVRMIESYTFETTIDMSNLANGFYTFTVTMSDKTQTTAKIVKE